MRTAKLSHQMENETMESHNKSPQISGVQDPDRSESQQSGTDEFRVIFNSLHDGILLHEDGIILDGNQAISDMFGYTVQEAIGTPVLRYIDPEYHDRVMEHLGSGSEEPYELVCLRKDGSRFPAEIRARNRTFREKSIRVVSVTDLSSHRQIEENLRNARERFELLFEHAPDAYYINDLKGTFLDGNLAAENLTGYKREELIGMSFLKLKLLPASQIPKAAQLLALNALGKSTGPDQFTLNRRDGSRVDVEILSAPMKMGGKNVVLGIARDISERKIMEEALRESETDLRNLFETINEGVIWISPDHKILKANPAAEQIMKLIPSNIRGAPYSVPETEFLRSDGSPMPPEEMAEYRAMTERQPIRNVAMGLKIQSNPITWINYSAIPLFDETGELKGAVATFMDVTGQKELETQLMHSQKMEAVGRLAGSIAHDFNNVLTVISGNAEISLSKMSEDDPLRERIEGIEKAARHAEALTRQLLAFSRKQIIQPQLLDLNSVLAHLYPMLKRLIGEDVELITERDRKICPIMADPGQIEQIMVNLAVNARQAMPGGGKIIIETDEVDLDESYVLTHPYIEPGHYAMLAFSDTGCGMPDEVKSKIFEPFFTTKKEGTGLGLSTVYGIVRQCGGSIIVYSEVDIGTTFKIFLPPADEEGPEDDYGEADEDNHRGTETILLVEDEASVRQLTAEILEDLGYKVHPCESPAVARQVCSDRGESIDLLLTDVVLPEQNGVKLARLLRDQIPDLRVLYMSGYTDDAIVHYGVLEQEKAFLPKPFTPAVLAAKVREVLDE